jgi:hypothetical protein
MLLQSTVRRGRVESREFVVTLELGQPKTARQGGSSIRQFAVYYLVAAAQV